MRVGGHLEGQEQLWRLSPAADKALLEPKFEATPFAPPLGYRPTKSSEPVTIPYMVMGPLTARSGPAKIQTRASPKRKVHDSSSFWSVYGHATPTFEQKRLSLLET